MGVLSKTDALTPTIPRVSLARDKEGEKGGVKRGITEVLREDVLGCMSDPIIDIEGGARGLEIAIVEGEEVFILIG